MLAKPSESAHELHDQLLHALVLRGRRRGVLGQALERRRVEEDGDED